MSRLGMRAEDGFLAMLLAPMQAHDVVGILIARSKLRGGAVVLTMRAAACARRRL